MSDVSFESLMRRLRAGDESAAGEVVRDYMKRLVGLARRALASRMGPKVDPDDVALSALDSFLQRAADGDFELTDREQLWTLLATIAARKAGRWNARFRADKRDLRREWAADLMDAESSRQWEAVGPSPTPSEVAVAGETLERLLASCALPVHRRILQLRLEGCTHAEIARQVGRTQVTVARVLRKSREQLQSWLQETDAPEAE